MKTVQGLVNTAVQEMVNVSGYKFSEAGQRASAAFMSAFDKQTNYMIDKFQYLNQGQSDDFDTEIKRLQAERDKLINKLGARIVFQIHDELILDCPKENSEAVKKRLQRLMEVSSTNVGVVLPMKCDMTTETRWGEDTMTSELREAYQKLIENKVSNPLKALCEEFCNFPEDSIRQIICSDNEILKFEW